MGIVRPQRFEGRSFVKTKLFDRLRRVPGDASVAKTCTSPITVIDDGNQRAYARTGFTAPGPSITMTPVHTPLNA
jgi:hypothetical protein